MLTSRIVGDAKDKGFGEFVEYSTNKAAVLYEYFLWLF